MSKEKTPENFVDKAHEHASFIDEIRGIAVEEKRMEESGEKGGTAYFRYEKNFDPQELTLEDKEIYDKVKDETITAPEFHEYEKSVRDKEGSSTKSGHRATRIQFLNFIANRSSSIFIRREMEESRARRRQAKQT